MISFGQTKNHLQRLKSYLTKMQYFATQGKKKFTIKDLQQQNFRMANNQIFLPLINFILLEYSSDLYMSILDYFPSLKFQVDKNFVQNAISIARRMLNLQVNLTADQFLTNKYFQKKLQFVTNMAKCVYQRTQSNKKAKTKGLAIEAPIAQKLSQIQMDAQFDDFEQQMPMTITAVPAKIDIQQMNKKLVQKPKQKKQPVKSYQLKSTAMKNANFINNFSKMGKTFTVDGQQFDEDEIKRALQERHPTPVLNLKRPTQQTASISDRTKSKQYVSQSKENDQIGDQDRYDQYRLQQTKQNKKHQNTHIQSKISPPQNHSKGKTAHSNNNKPRRQIEYENNQQSQQSLPTYHHPINDHSNCVTKTQFNQLVKLIKVVSQTVNELSSKFGDLQSNISTQVNNMAARVMMLESSVRLIKDNL